MSDKIVYIHYICNPHIVCSGSACGVNVLTLFERALISRGFKVINKKGGKACVKSIALCDFVVIADFSMDAKKIYDLCLALNKEYVFFPFHEDEEWTSYAIDFFFDISYRLENRVFNPSKETLFEQRQVGQTIKGIRQAIFKGSLFSFINSNLAAYEIRKECPSVVLGKCMLSCGIVKDSSYPRFDRFLEVTGLKKDEYILQVGRVNLRKNQIASVLGTRNLSYPMVFIFNEYCPEYLKVLVKTIQSSNCRQKIYFVTDVKAASFSDKVKVVETKIDHELVISAYQHAGLHLHPSFYECPGYTYLEAAKLGVATVASSWSSVSEYLSDAEGEFGLHEGFEFVRPDDIEGIEAGAKKMFGKKFARPDLPIFNRTDVDVQRDMGVLIDRYML